MSIPHQLGFFDLSTRYEALSQQGDPLEQLAHVIPWEAFRPTLAKALRRSKRTKGGRPPFDAVRMFKILVLQALYNLSDDQTEYQIRDRLSFMRFLGLDLEQRIPAAKTIWLFRETLAQAQVVETLFAHFETYLADHGLQPRGGQLIDASLVPVPKQRNSRNENATLKAGDCPTEWKGQPAKQRQKDTEARWTVKHGANHYGYKNHVNVDKQHKLIRQYTVTDAAVHDSQVLEKVLLPVTAGRNVWADSAYRSAEIEAQLKARRLQSKIHWKGYRQTPLTAQQQAHNRCRSRIRARVEHVFGHQVTAMGGKLIRTVGLVRARLKIGMKNLTYNFHRYLILSIPQKAQVA
ncbi:IS5 family transposase [uncultured Nitrospira sp.]|uniref:IS5 family transposase n=1 Tax=uncultured Nitrospira sp. TaxID=157176 RepID=UPI0031404F24